MGFLGAAVGAAATGLKPVVEMMFIEFIGVALDQLTTEATRLRYLSRGQVTVPLVVRASPAPASGSGVSTRRCSTTGSAASVDSRCASCRTPRTLTGCCGRRSVTLTPSSSSSRVLYGERQELVTGEEGIVALGEARVVSPGDDVTIVTAGTMVGVAQEAATLMADTSCEVIDLQTLVPWDKQAVVESVARTGRLVVVEEGPWTAGWSNDVAAHVSTELFGSLRSPVLRITCPDAPVPHSEALERRFVPSPSTSPSRPVS